MENFKIRVNPEQSRAVQETVFKNGLSWMSGDAKIMCLNSVFLFLTDGVLTYGFCDKNFNNHPNTEITFAQFESRYINKFPPHISDLSFAEMEVRNLNSEEWRVKKVICVKDLGCYAIDGLPIRISHFNQYRPIKSKTTITKKQIAEKFGIDVETLTIEE